MHAEEAEDSEERESGGAKRDGSGEVDFKTEIERGRFACSLRDGLHADGGDHAETDPADSDVERAFETAVQYLHRTGAEDCVGDVDLDAGGCDRGGAGAVERDLYGELVDGDNAEVGLDLDVDFQCERIEACDACARDLEEITERSRQIEEARVAEIQRVALAGVQHDLEVDWMTEVETDADGLVTHLQRLGGLDL